MARHRSASSRRRSKSRTPCRESHSYGAGQEVGAGIVRYVCALCGAVSIDITRSDTLVSPGSLFESTEGTLERT